MCMVSVASDQSPDRSWLNVSWLSSPTTMSSYPSLVSATVLLFAWIWISPSPFNHTTDKNWLSVRSNLHFNNTTSGLLTLSGSCSSVVSNALMACPETKTDHGQQVYKGKIKEHKSHLTQKRLIRCAWHYRPTTMHNLSRQLIMIIL